MNINKAIISGNLTRDPELRATAAGTPVLQFGVAVNDRAKNQQTGQWEDRPNFLDCVMFGNRAQSVAPYLSKGTKVAVEGKLRWSQWQAQDGSKRSKVEIVVDEIEFMSSRDQSVPVAPVAPVAPVQAAAAQPVYSQQQMAGMPAPVTVSSVYDEDIPF